MMTILAQAQAASSQSSLLITGAVVLGLTSILNLIVAGKQLLGGNKGERQIEPTQLAALQQQMEKNHTAAQSELRSQTSTLTKLDREVGEIKTSVGNVQNEVTTLRKEQKESEAGVFRRVNAISTESTETRTRVEILERQAKGGRG